LVSAVLSIKGRAFEAALLAFSEKLDEIGVVIGTHTLGDEQKAYEVEIDEVRRHVNEALRTLHGGQATSL
jgi:hypothetical protein